jgi:hypothetical protein
METIPGRIPVITLKRPGWPYYVSQKTTDAVADTFANRLDAGFSLSIGSRRWVLIGLEYVFPGVLRSKQSSQQVAKQFPVKGFR